MQVWTGGVVRLAQQGRSGNDLHRPNDAAVAGRVWGLPGRARSGHHIIQESSQVGAGPRHRAWKAEVGVWRVPCWSLEFQDSVSILILPLPMARGSQLRSLKLCLQNLGQANKIEMLPQTKHSEDGQMGKHINISYVQVTLLVNFR